jgi:hypothetical protein
VVRLIRDDPVAAGAEANVAAVTVAKKRRGQVMRSLTVSARLLLGLVLAAGFLAIAGADQSQAVSKYARVTIHLRECPEGTGDLFGKCHDDPIANFDLGGCNPNGFCTEKGTGSNGNVRFGPRAGWNEFYVAEANSYVGSYIYCSDDASKKVLIDGRADDGDFAITTTRGRYYTCDWYLLTAKK